MRGFLVLAALAVLILTVWPLVKDPMCQTYVVRSRAIRNEAGGRSVYFCSPRCAEQFRERERSA